MNVEESPRHGSRRAYLVTTFKIQSSTGWKTVGHILHCTLRATYEFAAAYFCPTPHLCQPYRAVQDIKSSRNPLNDACLSFPVPVSARYSTSTRSLGVSHTAFGFLIFLVSGWTFALCLSASRFVLARHHSLVSCRYGHDPSAIMILSAGKS